ncbi:MAG: hypothetical protein HY423_02220 [Candidatus Lambdaproteobacteria bacterium]|nr:hypothetical protein [Candidatus Lambdaproteobacteria bacterium]
MRWIAPSRAALPFALLLALLAACQPDTKDSPPTPAYANRVLAYAPGTLVINGTYPNVTVVYCGSTAYTINLQKWEATSAVCGTQLVHTSSYNNAGQYLIGQNDATDPYNPNLYSRFDWVISGGDIYYCQSAYDAVTPAAAEAVAAANRADLISGCGSFSSPWSKIGAPAWPYFFDPSRVLGPPGDYTNVVSLGYNPALSSALGGTLVLGFGAAGDPADRRCAVDGPGADIVVIENPFRTTDSQGNAGTNNELATVEVSADGSTWYEFPPTIDAGKALIDPARYTGFAGVIPANEGGDRFDLAAIPGPPDGFLACYVRLTDGGTRWADYGNTQSDANFSGADIDAVEALYTVPAAATVP